MSMSKYVKLIESAERKQYKGDALEFGGTSIRATGAAPAVKWLFEKGHITEGMKVIDFGAGKYGRNAEYLKEMGCEVYAYDPYNGKDSNGWEGVSTTLPSDRDFDVGFTSFVLNVVPVSIENEIIRDVKQYSSKSIHITRNMDIYDSIKVALERGDETVTNFFNNEYADDELKEKLENGELTKEEIIEFCEFGTATSRGFQRIPDLTDRGFEILRKTSKFKIFTK